MRNLIIVFVLCLVSLLTSAQNTVNSSATYVVTTTQVQIIVPSDVTVEIKHCKGSRMVVDQTIQADMSKGTLEYFEELDRWNLKATRNEVQDMTVLRAGTNLPLMNKQRKIIDERVQCTVIVPESVKFVEIINL